MSKHCLKAQPPSEGRKLTKFSHFPARGRVVYSSVYVERRAKIKRWIPLEEAFVLSCGIKQKGAVFFQNQQAFNKFRRCLLLIYDFSLRLTSIVMLSTGKGTQANTSRKKRRGGLACFGKWRQILHVIRRQNSRTTFSKTSQE